MTTTQATTPETETRIAHCCPLCGKAAEDYYCEHIRFGEVDAGYDLVERAQSRPVLRDRMSGETWVMGPWR